MSKKKKEKIVYKEKVNWRKELSLLPGYLIVTIWVLFTAVFLLWILGASLSTSREIFSGSVFKFETGLHFENYVSAWQTQNVSVFFGNSLLYAVVSCTVVILISAPAAYVLSRFGFKGSKQIRGSLILAMSCLLYTSGKALPVIEIAPLNGFYDYKNKYQAGSTVETCPADLSPEKTEEIQEISERVFEVLRLKNYARMDFMMAKDGSVYCLEANTLPGMTPTSLIPQEAQAMGVGFEDLCEWILKLAFRG